VDSCIFHAVELFLSANKYSILRKKKPVSVLIHDFYQSFDDSRLFQIDNMFHKRPDGYSQGLFADSNLLFFLKTANPPLSNARRHKSVKQEDTQQRKISSIREAVPI
jgi:hypothetical protein